MQALAANNLHHRQARALGLKGFLTDSAQNSSPPCASRPDVAPARYGRGGRRLRVVPAIGGQAGVGRNRLPQRGLAGGRGCRSGRRR